MRNPYTASVILIQKLLPMGTLIQKLLHMSHSSTKLLLLGTLTQELLYM